MWCRLTQTTTLSPYTCHTPVPLSINPPPHFVWNYSKADLEGLQSYLFDRNFDACLQLEDVNDIWSHIKKHIYGACQLFVPRVKVPKSPSPKWFDLEIRHMQKNSHTLRRRYNRSPTDHTLSKINHTELLLQDLIISSKIDYKHHLVSNYYSEPGKLFDYLKNLSKSTPSNYSIFHNSKPVSIPEQKSQMFNDYLNSVLTLFFLQKISYHPLLSK